MPNIKGINSIFTTELLSPVSDYHNSYLKNKNNRYFFTACENYPEAS